MQVQLQVSLGVAQEVGGGGGEGGAALGSDDCSGMAMKGGDYGMFDWVREGKSEAGRLWIGGRRLSSRCSACLPTCGDEKKKKVVGGESRGCKVFPTTHTHSPARTRTHSTLGIGGAIRTDV